MATNVILPALGMSQDTGKIVQWLKREGEQVRKGEPLFEIETDKATVEIEAPADGILSKVTGAAGEDVPVGQVIALILASGEVSPDKTISKAEPKRENQGRNGISSATPLFSQQSRLQEPIETTRQSAIAASPVASRIAVEHNLDLSQVKSAGKRIQKADVLAYMQSLEPVSERKSDSIAASPKARRLAREMGKDLATIKGSGPEGAIIAIDVLQTQREMESAPASFNPLNALSSYPPSTKIDENGSGKGTGSELTLSTNWRIMAERTTQSWNGIPHFYLVREVNASRLIAWREQILKRATEKITYSDLLVKIVAASLRLHPRVNASWYEGTLTLKPDIHIGLAVAIESGLVVPVIHLADTLRLKEIAQRRKDIVKKSQEGKLRPQDIQNGTFTISNLGMYNIDAFNAIINQPQAAILAVGRIAERVVPLNGVPAIQPMMTLTLSCDHRAVDGARAAQFLATLAELIEEPLGLLA